MRTRVATSAPPFCDVAQTVTRRPGRSAALVALPLGRAIAASPASVIISDCWRLLLLAAAHDAGGAQAQERGPVAAHAPRQHARHAQLARRGGSGARGGRQAARAREHLVGIDRRAAARQVLEAELRGLARARGPEQPLNPSRWAARDLGAVLQAREVGGLAVAVPAEVLVHELIARRSSSA